jgi:hypothetical protein
METETEIKGKGKAKSIPTSHLLIIISSGILFGLGLSMSEMVNPSRVLGFLNILGTWDPTLLFVMLGAVRRQTLLDKVSSDLRDTLAHLG